MWHDVTGEALVLRLIFVCNSLQCVGLDFCQVSQRVPHDHIPLWSFQLDLHMYAVVEEAGTCQCAIWTENGAGELQSETYFNFPIRIFRHFIWVLQKCHLEYYTRKLKCNGKMCACTRVHVQTHMQRSLLFCSWTFLRKRKGCFSRNRFQTSLWQTCP